MINTIDDLVRYTEQEADAEPLIASDTRITRPGCRPDVIAALREAFPGLPEDYLSVLEAIAIDRISIGYFGLTPSSSPTLSLVEKLRVYNDPAMTPMAECYQRDGVYEVASWEAAPICIVHTDGIFKVGQVIKYDDVAPDASRVVLADSFERFLLIAGNLQEIRGRHDEPEPALREFKEYLKPLVAERQDGMASEWMEIADEVLE